MGMEYIEPPEYTEPPVEEGRGYMSRPGYVKQRPENNQHYLDQFKNDPWYPVLVELDRRIEEIAPGYNIAQIKEKFGGLRYYIDAPASGWGTVDSTAGERAEGMPDTVSVRYRVDQLIELAENVCYGIEIGRKHRG